MLDAEQRAFERWGTYAVDSFIVACREALVVRMRTEVPGLQWNLQPLSRNIGVRQ
jgi:hypothetical protein